MNVRCVPRVVDFRRACAEVIYTIHFTQIVEQSEAGEHEQLLIDLVTRHVCFSISPRRVVRKSSESRFCHEFVQMD